MFKLIANFLRIFSPRKVVKNTPLHEVSAEADWQRLILRVERQYDRAVRSTETHKKVYFNRYGKEMPEDIYNEILKKKLGLA